MFVATPFFFTEKTTCKHAGPIFCISYNIVSHIVVAVTVMLRYTESDISFDIVLSDVNSGTRGVGISAR